MRLCAKDPFFVLQQPYKAMMAATHAESKTDNLKREEAVKICVHWSQETLDMYSTLLFTY